MTEKNRPGRRKKRRGPLYRLLSFLAIGAALLLGITVFFRITEISVEGGTRYSEDEIITASGVEIGQHLLFIDQVQVAGQIRTRLPYAEKITIKRVFPSKLVIHVTDASQLAYIERTRDTVLLDQGCKILEVISDEAPAGLISVKGISPISPEVGEIIAVEEGDAAKVSYLSQLLTLLLENGMSGDVTGIDLSNVNNVTFDLFNRFTVQLGGNDELAYKIQMLSGVLAQLSENERGTIDLARGNPANFVPE